MFACPVPSNKQCSLVAFCKKWSGSAAADAPWRQPMYTYCEVLDSLAHWRPTSAQEVLYGCVCMTRTVLHFDATDREPLQL